MHGFTLFMFYLLVHLLIVIVHFVCEGFIIIGVAL